jgi:hypothetical protein
MRRLPLPALMHLREDHPMRLYAPAKAILAAAWYARFTPPKRRRLIFPKAA